MEGGDATLTVNGIIRRFVGTLHLVIGDDIGQRQLAGLLGPRALACSRYTYRLSRHFSILEHPFVDNGVVVNSPRRRNPEEDRRAYEEYATARLLREGQIGKAEAALRDRGLKMMTCLWRLRFFAMFFYLHFGICLLHLHLEGSWKRCVLYLAFKYGRAFWTELNQRIASYPTYRNLLKFKYGIFVEKTSKKTGDKRLSLDHLTGDQMDSITQILEVCLVGLVPQADLAVISHYFDYDRLCRLREFPPAVLDHELPQARTRWKEAFVGAFRGVDGCSLSYPNFDTEDHVEEAIRQTGPLWIQNTAEDESRHRVAKARGGNQLNLSRDVLDKTDRAVFNAPIKLPTRSSSKSQLGFNALGKGKKLTAGHTIDAVRMRMADLVPGATVLSVVEHAGFRTCSSLVYATSDIVITFDNATELFVYLLGVFCVVLQDAPSGKKVERLLIHAEQRDRLGTEMIGAHEFAILGAPSVPKLIPLGWGNWQVLRQVSIVRHPTDAGRFIYNDRVRHEVDCRLRPPADDAEDVPAEVGRDAA
eukprot:TRINITY_DN611_c0_g1_i10.p1 TRINITY_DN611_c0_g1~~TRINITY_DN611_c0_g1_i10.p1  ORF type:complete len:532 (-),score=43.58 TRINITY_DN611_c0_g1_i10:608-2203(-)